VNPDLVMSGSLRRFYGRSYVDPAMWAAFLPFGLPPVFGVPIYTSRGQVELEITFERLDGQRVAEYSAAKEFSRRSTIYRAPMLGIGTRLNEALSTAVADVRRQILADRLNLLRARSAELGPDAGPSGAERDPRPNRQR
jgi:hypothetical protein